MRRAWWTALSIAPLVWLGAPGAARAEPTACPEIDFVPTCTLELGDSRVAVSGESVLGPSVVEWEKGGLLHLQLESLAIEAFHLFELDGSSRIDLFLQSASQDAAAGEIQMAFTDLFDDVELDLLFQLDDAAGLSTLEERVTVRSNAAGQSLRLFAVTNFDLDGTPVDDDAFRVDASTVLEQLDGDTTARFQTLSPVWDAYEVARCCALSSALDLGILVDLANTDAGPGPGDFELAASWDRTLDAGQSLQIEVRKTIRVPAPGTAAADLAALLGLVLLRRRGRRGERWAPRGT